MSRADSDRILPSAGFTLIEVTVALVASGILLVGLARFFKDFNRSYNSQEQVADRDLNAHYTVKRMSEALMAAGSNLPAKDWPIINMPDGNPGGRMRLAVNPRGGVQYLAAPLAGAIEVTVDDAKGFAKATELLADPQIDGFATFKVAIDLAYSADGFTKGFKVSGDNAILRLTTGLTLAAGDAIYAYDVEDYRLMDGNLMLNDMVLAENIQNMSFTMLTAAQVPTTQWSAMRSAKVNITARTRSRDPGYATNGGYRSIDLSMDVLLRNRL
jgi:prepilin-type N-terminal cleavage/methylation domain-containing protein